MIIGLTGKYCAGKNYVAAILEKKGLPVLDVDKLGYQALETEKKLIFSLFGNDLQGDDGSLDRRLLGQRVFGNPEKLKQLENIVHPPVNRMTDEWIASQSPLVNNSLLNSSLVISGHCVINAALLHRSVVFSKLDLIILITAPLFIRLLRAKRRDRLSWPVIYNRFSSQKNFNSQYLSVNAEIYKVGNPEISDWWNLHRRCNEHQILEGRIDKILEGIK